jgi:hypothetical protein
MYISNDSKSKLKEKKMIKTKVAAIALVIAFSLTNPVHAQSDPDPHRFDKSINAFRAWDAKNAIPNNPILFVGSSSIRMWKSAKSFPDLPVVNRGFGGAHISDMLFFKQDILLKYKKPACLVMYCGGNDVTGGKSAERVVDDFKKWWDVVQTAFPGTPLVYIPIKPCPNRWDIWDEEKKANKMIESMCDADRLLFYADTATPMLATGQPPADALFIADKLHLSDKGYEMWDSVVRKAIHSALN